MRARNGQNQPQRDATLSMHAKEKQPMDSATKKEIARRRARAVARRAGWDSPTLAQAVAAIIASERKRTRQKTPPSAKLALQANSRGRPGLRSASNEHKRVRVEGRTLDISPLRVHVRSAGTSSRCSPTQLASATAKGLLGRRLSLRMASSPPLHKRDVR